MTSCSAASTAVPALMCVPAGQSDLAGGTGPTERCRCSALIPNPCTPFFSSTQGGCCSYGLKLFHALFFSSVVFVCLFFQGKQCIVYETLLHSRSLQSTQGSRSHPGSGIWPCQKHEGQGFSRVCMCHTRATQTHNVPVVTSVCRASVGPRASPSHCLLLHKG